MTRFSTVLFVCAAVVTPAFLNAQVQVSTQVFNTGRAASVTTVTNSAEPAHHPSRVLVHFRPGRPHGVLPGSGPTRAFPGNANLVLVENPPGLTVREVVGRYKGNTDVEYAEPDYIVQSIATPNDTLWAQQWDMTKIKADVAWDTQKNASDVVEIGRAHV